MRTSRSCPRATAAACSRSARSGRLPTMPNEMEAAVLAADDQRFEAMRKENWPALEAALADELTYVHSTARLESKAEHVGNLKAGKPHYRGIAPRERTVRVRGEVGIVNGISEMHVENAGKEQRFTVRY